MPLRITTWNVNSVRLRLEGLARLVREVDPDVLCLQETKVRNDLFPALELRALGFEHQLLHGQPGYHGVAILSKMPLEEPRASTGAARSTAATSSPCCQAASSCTISTSRPAATCRIARSIPSSGTSSTSSPS